jgi:ribosome silencing factor RsfS/YbeB/iojap
MKLDDVAMRILKIINDKKGENIQVGGPFSLTDYTIVATVLSNRQMHAISQEISKEFKKHTYTEGDSQSDWLLIDLAGMSTIHLMKPEARKFYDLEDLFQLYPYNSKEQFRTNIS